MQIFTPNTAGRDFVVGDLHGCFGLLMLALDKLAFDFKRDRLFSVGDLIDRGEQSEQCLKLLDEPWMHAIAGNHEYMFIEMLKSEAHTLHFLKMGVNGYLMRILPALTIWKHGTIIGLAVYRRCTGQQPLCSPMG